MIKMAENRVFIRAEALQLEGLLEGVTGDSGVVVTHPHPQYGGDMHNNVVDAIVKAYRKNGYSTLRFNFRGVGASQGAFDNGIGEREDVRAAIAYLSGLGKKNIDLAGYSFGAWVNALGLETFEHVSRMIMVSPPVGLLDFDPVVSYSKIKLVIAGSRDDIARVGAIEKKMPAWNPKAVLRVIQDADHFYWGKTDEIETIINEFLREKTLL